MPSTSHRFILSKALFLSHEKIVIIKKEKTLFFSLIFVIIIGFLAIAGFFSVEFEGPLFAGFFYCFATICSPAGFGFCFVFFPFLVGQNALNFPDPLHY
jgi:hypothetical protein